MIDRIQRTKNIETFTPGSRADKYTFETIKVTQKRQMNEVRSIDKQQAKTVMLR